jgi:hypothetical protein
MQRNRLARQRAFGMMAAAGIALAAGWAVWGGVLTSGHLAGQSAPGVSYSAGPIRDVSVGCPGTGDISQAVDRARHYVYQEFEGCDDGNGIGFARSADGGKSYTRPVALPGSDGGWDPWLAVAPDGIVYAAFMDTLGNRTYPVIDVSRDHGRTFRAGYSLRPALGDNWGDADYLAAGPNGTLYVAWDYGPPDPEVNSACSPTGSCWATSGDLNVVVQSSADEARTFTPASVVNPGYPDGGADEGSITVAPNGVVDVLYQGYEVTNRKTLTLARGHEYFTTSADGGKKWSAPVEVGPPPRPRWQSAGQRGPGFARERLGLRGARHRADQVTVPPSGPGTRPRTANGPMAMTGWHPAWRDRRTRHLAAPGPRTGGAKGR